MNKREELLAKIAARREREKLTPAAPAQVATKTNTERDRIKALLSSLPKPEPEPAQTQAVTPTPTPAITLDGDIQWNPEQLQAISYGSELRSFCLIGAAGTGKTTTVKEIARQVIASTQSTISSQCPSKHLVAGFPAIAFVSFTNRAVQNIKKAVSEIDNMDRHALTIHKLLEYFPNQVEVYDEQENEWRKSMRFEPTFHEFNPLKDLKLIVIDESSMVGCELFKKLHDACPNAVFIFIGDLNQLAPVFGDAILGFKLAEIPVVELTRVYRQALESPIVAFQHNYTLKGKLPSDTELKKLSEENKGLTFTPFKAVIKTPTVLCKAVANKMERYLEEGKYNPEEDIILMPFNKEFGTVQLNKDIAQFLGDRREAVVHEIIAGYEKKYFAVGDFVIWNKEEYLIKEINKNTSYIGQRPQEGSKDLTREGKYKIGSTLRGDGVEDSLFDAINSMIDGEDVENQASHEVVLTPKDDPDREIALLTRGDINALDFGYAITIHKSQGSEWRKVILILTNHHAVMLCREILYTGMTRAREELEVIYDPQTQVGKKNNTVAKSILRQRIRGKTWQDKLEHFKGKYDNYSAIMAKED